ncbi:hypothetical protein QQ045_032770 [Rhodiola kirilowii]
MELALQRYRGPLMLVENAIRMSFSQLLKLLMSSIIKRILVSDDFEDTCMYQLNAMGQKTSTGGWFVSDGESDLLVHDDASCSLYDVAKSERRKLHTNLHLEFQLICGEIAGLLMAAQGDISLPRQLEMPWIQVSVRGTTTPRMCRLFT